MMAQDRYSTKLVSPYLTRGSTWGVWDNKIEDWAAPRFRTLDKAEALAETERRTAEELRVVSTVVRLPPAIHEALKGRALRARRSLNSEMVAAFEAYLATD